MSRKFGHRFLALEIVYVCSTAHGPDNDAVLAWMQFINEVDPRDISDKRGTLGRGILILLHKIVCSESGLWFH